jgi:hypothetical protein
MMVSFLKQYEFYTDIRLMAKKPIFGFADNFSCRKYIIILRKIGRFSKSYYIKRCPRQGAPHSTYA